MPLAPLIGLACPAGGVAQVAGEPKMGGMLPGDLEDLARLVRQVLTLAGLADRTGNEAAGGYVVWTLDDQVTVDWMPAQVLFDEAQQRYRHPAHPLAVLDQELRAVMERAVAGVLYAAGFTVALQPPLRDAGPDEESGAKVVVTSPPRIRAWTTG
jgi:hypothetical protein